MGSLFWAGTDDATNKKPKIHHMAGDFPLFLYLRFIGFSYILYGIVIRAALIILIFHLFIQKTEGNKIVILRQHTKYFS